LKTYLLDTNICIYFIKGLYELNRKIEAVGPTNCFISEMTVAELKYGVENSKTPELMRPIVEAFIPKFAVIPVYDALDVYAAEKARLRRQGLILDDFDILIGATAIVNNMALVSNNQKHMNRLANIKLQDWTTAEPA
jgi:tRNA(fMet)-specific endonuclease VapC